MDSIYFSISSENGSVTEIKLSELPDDDRAGKEGPAGAGRQITEYLEGRRKEFSFPFRFDSAGFAGRVFDVVRSIPYGEKLTYSDIAVRLGDRKKARAVGNALAKNPLLLLIPCHRVIKSDGSTGGYRAGARIKDILLTMESERRNNGQL